jgi:hypothetical protein
MQEQPQLEVNIDFDEATRVWRSNKIPQGNETYKYKCEGITQKGHQCTKTANTANIFATGFFCTQHSPDTKSQPQN